MNIILRGPKKLRMSSILTKHWSTKVICEKCNNHYWTTYTVAVMATNPIYQKTLGICETCLSERVDEWLF